MATMKITNSIPMIADLVTYKISLLKLNIVTDLFNNPIFKRIVPCFIAFVELFLIIPIQKQNILWGDIYQKLMN